MATIETFLGPLSWQADEVGIRFEIGGKRDEARWDEITAAALVRTDSAAADSYVLDDVWQGLGRGLPGLGKLIGVNAYMAENYWQLVLAKGTDQKRAIRMPLPMDDAGTHSLVEGLKQRLGIRWRGETTMGDHYKTLDMKQPRWTIPVSILFIIGLGYIVAFACMGFTSLAEGNFSLPTLVWAGMVVWLAIVGGIAYLYRRAS